MASKLSDGFASSRHCGLHSIGWHVPADPPAREVYVERFNSEHAWSAHAHGIQFMSFWRGESVTKGVATRLDARTLIQRKSVRTHSRRSQPSRVESQSQHQFSQGIPGRSETIRDFRSMRKDSRAAPSTSWCRGFESRPRYNISTLVERLRSDSTAAKPTERCAPRDRGRVAASAREAPRAHTCWQWTWLWAARATTARREPRLQMPRQALLEELVRRTLRACSARS